MIININSNESQIKTLQQQQQQTSEMTELRRLKLRDPSPIQSSSTLDKDILTFIEIPIEKTDTLLGLSLKYGCASSQIKRLNNLSTDLELYALNTCRIPIKEHSVQSAIYEKDLKRVHINDLYWLNNKRIGDNFEFETEVYATSDNEDSYANNNDDMKKPLLETVTKAAAVATTTTTTTSSNQPKAKEATMFLKNIDKDLETIRATTIQQKQQMLGSPPSPVFNSNSSMLLNDSTYIKPDRSLCDYKEVIIILFIILFVIPGVIYVYLRILDG